MFLQRSFYKLKCFLQNQPLTPLASPPFKKKTGALEKELYFQFLETAQATWSALIILTFNPIFSADLTRDLFKRA